MNLLKQGFNINYSPLKYYQIFLIFLGVALFIRFPFFFRDYIDRDESTFILMGQSWAEGHLPYTALWDLKPPLAFFFFAAIIKIFGKSFIAIRLAGTIGIAVTSLYMFRIGDRLSGKRAVGFWCGMLYIFLSSLFGNVQGVMTEHLSMLFAVPAFWFLIKASRKWHIFLAGALFGIAAMTKLNLAYPILFIGLGLMFFEYREKGIYTSIQKGFLYGTGILVPVLLTIIPYYIDGLLWVWWESVILAPLHYDTPDPANNIDAFVDLLPFIGIAAVLIFLNSRKRCFPKRCRNYTYILLALAGTMFSFIQSGEMNSHYLIQLYPYLILPLAIIVSHIKWPLKVAYTPFVAVVLLLIQFEPIREYCFLGDRALDGKSLYNGEGIEVPKYINTHFGNVQSVFFLENHIGYWLTNEDPPTKSVTHPSNLDREQLYPFYDNPRKNSVEEIRYICSVINPQIIVTEKGKIPFMKDDSPDNIYFKNILATQYRFIKRIGEAEIYSRIY
ncbi:ArnT family glycosyltransferase [Sinomicrobium weinanense]|uniref:Glycosyltransferase family 39 protein n=1 Tax=Sinomicrobium weinanense TaxID=2842200 RepID=A0A926JNB2_9FLAO|nr:glycosyltransferase family 39 protein [Sinomicrobium weinanense]MBC9794435.1 glycosyltransferase family 39 protein [Sinomicrobium weinanense]MBU3124342.1 glycosyltransferase family 39 protein [Sinomicrobium weinanense]